MEKFFLAEIYEEGCPTEPGRGTMTRRRVSPVFKTEAELSSHIKVAKLKKYNLDDLEVVYQYGARNVYGLQEESTVPLEDWIPAND